MNSKAIRKQLLAAVAMVLVAAVALGSSTYAWFASNASVTASGMKISAKNDTGALIIGGTKYEEGTKQDPSVTSVQAAHLTAINLGDTGYNYTTDFAVKPSQHVAGTEEAPLKISTLDTVGNWSYKIANNPASYASSGDATVLTGFSDYVLYYDLWITVATGSPDMKELKCDATITATGDSAHVRDAVRVVVASETAAEEFYNAHTSSGASVAAHTTGATVLDDTIKSTELTHVRVYIYLDGEDATVYTNNFKNLAEATVSLTFTASDLT